MALSRSFCSLAHFLPYDLTDLTAADKLTRNQDSLVTLWWSLFFAGMLASAADYRAPAGTRPAIRHPGAPSILPGGRIIAPTGRQYVTGPGPFGLALSPSHRIVLSVNSGPERFSLTLLERD